MEGLDLGVLMAARFTGYEKRYERAQMVASRLATHGTAPAFERHSVPGAAALCAWLGCKSSRRRRCFVPRLSRRRLELEGVLRCSEIMAPDVWKAMLANEVFGGLFPSGSVAIEAELRLSDERGATG